MIFQSGNKTLSGSFGFPQYKDFHRKNIKLKVENMKTEQIKKENAPTLKIRAGNITVSVFENAVKEGSYISYNLQKSYTRDEGKTWENMNISLNMTEIHKVISVLNKAYEETALIVQE